MNRVLRGFLWMLSDWWLAFRCGINGHPESLLCGTDYETGNHPILRCSCGKKHLSFPPCHGNHRACWRYDLPVMDERDVVTGDVS